jgi:hypothetical protein
MDFTKNTNQLIFGSIILVLVAGGIGYWIGRAGLPAVRSGEEVREEGTDQPPVDLSGAVLTGGNALTVNDQPAGTMVQVASVTLTETGWVAIHEDKEGQPGKIIGAQRFRVAADRTLTTSGTVTLLEPTVSGKSYHAMLHGDAGADGFSYKEDLPLKDASGNAIVAHFVVQ